MLWDAYWSAGDAGFERGEKRGDGVSWIAREEGRRIGFEVSRTVWQEMADSVSRGEFWRLFWWVKGLDGARFALSRVGWGIVRLDCNPAGAVWRGEGGEVLEIEAVSVLVRP